MPVGTVALTVATIKANLSSLEVVRFDNMCRPQQCCVDMLLPTMADSRGQWLLAVVESTLNHNSPTPKYQPLSSVCVTRYGVFPKQQ